MFHFVYADEDGNGYINEDYFGLGLLGASFVEPGEEEVIPLPEGASLTMIPNRTPVVINDEDQFVLYPEEGWVMGALLPQGYTRTLLPAFVNNEGADGLPLFGYSAVFAAEDGELYVAALPTDEDYKWNPQYFNTDDLAERVEVLLSEEEVDKRIQEIGDQISKDYAGKQVHLVCVLKGAAPFHAELIKHIYLQMETDYVQIKSYEGTESTGIITLKKDLDVDISHKDVVIVEDIVDSGRTLLWLKQNLLKRNPNSLTFVSLLDKPSRRKVEFKPDYIGFTIEDLFVYGFGLDLDEKCRNLKDIYVK